MLPDAAERRANSRADAWAVALLVAGGALVFADFLFSSKNFYFRDILNFHYPLRQVLVSSYARGEFPLWNPFVYLGQPMLANPNYMALYPTNLLHLMFSFNYAFKLHFVLHPILGGIGAYFLQRRLGLQAAAAAGGAVAYEFSGTVLSFLNLYNIVPAVALLPWIGWAFVAAVESKGWGRSLVLGALAALQVFAVEPLMVASVIALVAALAVVQLTQSPDRAGTLGRIGRAGLAGGVFALALSAVQWLPALELMPNSGRGAGYGYAVASGWSMHPLDLVNTAVANLFGTLYTLNNSTYWGEAFHAGREPYLVSFFLGASALMIASVSWFSPRRALQRTLFVLTLFAVAFALGDYNAAYRWLYEHANVFHYGRYPSKYFLLATLGIALLVGLGLEVVSGAGADKRRRWIPLAGGAGLVLAAAVLGTWAYWQWHPRYVDALLRSQVDPAAAAGKDFAAIEWQLLVALRNCGLFLLVTSAGVLVSRFWRQGAALSALLALVIAAELAQANLRLSPLISDADVDFVPEVNRHLQRSGPPEPFRVVPPTLLSGSLPDLHLRLPNRSAAWLTLFYRMSGHPMYGLSQGLQYSIDQSVDNLDTRESHELWRACKALGPEGCLTLLQKINSPALLALNEVTDPRAQPVTSFATASETTLRLYWLDGTLPRAYFATGVARAGSQREALGLFLRRDFPYASTVVLEGSDVVEQPGLTGAGSVRILDYENRRVSCEVEALGPGHVVLLDSFYPGWQARVDDHPVEIRRANYAFRAVAVPAGKHHVEFLYRPRSFYAGLALSSVALLGGVASVLRRR
jgi:hypothetical protein